MNILNSWYFFKREFPKLNKLTPLNVNYIPGVVKSWAPQQTLELFKLPEYVKKQAQKILLIQK